LALKPGEQAYPRWVSTDTNHLITKNMLNNFE